MKRTIFVLLREKNYPGRQGENFFTLIRACESSGKKVFLSFPVREKIRLIPFRKRERDFERMERRKTFPISPLFLR